LALKLKLKGLMMSCSRTCSEYTAVDLMAPNLNKEKVQVKAQMLRQIAKQESQSVQARDKAALEKQRYVASVRVIRSCWGTGSDN
jgi:hypothetical protein